MTFLGQTRSTTTRAALGRRCRDASSSSGRSKDGYAHARRLTPWGHARNLSRFAPQSQARGINVAIRISGLCRAWLSWPNTAVRSAKTAMPAPGANASAALNRFHRLPDIAEIRSFRRGPAKSRKARSFIGNGPWPSKTMLTGTGAGPKRSSTVTRRPAFCAAAVW